MLQDFRLDDLGQVCMLSRWGIPAFLPPLSVSLQDSLRFLPIPLPPEEFGVTYVPLTVAFRTDPMGLTLFRRDPISEVFRCPESRGSARNCESAICKCRFRLHALLAQAYQSVSLVFVHAVYLGFTDVHHALRNLAPARIHSIWHGYIVP